MTNNHRCFCDLAPLYALDLLDLEERLWVEAQIAECPDLAEELASYQAAVSAMPYMAPLVPMAADLKDRLFDSLGLDPVATIPTSEPDPPLHPELFSIRADELEWKPHRVEGIECAVLFLDPLSRMRTLMVRARGGIKYPVHQHQGVEEIYMLEGELEIEGNIYAAGDYIRSHPNTIHAPFTVTNCLFLIRACIDDNYDENLVASSK
jgi:quercetin dioxygenase-like cupin family protein